MATLETVQNYIDRARVLLQDQVAPYRYADSELVEDMNLGLLEIRRLRPDLMAGYFTTQPPSYSSTSPTAAVDVDPQYRVALLYYLCGQAQLRDTEDVQDNRAVVFMNKFISQMLTIEA